MFKVTDERWTESMQFHKISYSTLFFSKISITLSFFLFKVWNICERNNRNLFYFVSAIFFVWKSPNHKIGKARG